MPSTFMGIEIAKRGLDAHNLGLVTIGHNLSNASTDGYSRQRVQLGAMDPLYAPDMTREDTPGQIGQGVLVDRVERVRDELLDGRIVAESGNEGYWTTRDKYLLSLEDIQNEPSDSSVRTLMDRFWGSWQDLSQRPDDASARAAVVSKGEALAEGMRNRYQRLTELRSVLDGDVRGTVEQVNSLAKEIAGLNGQIVQSKAVGDSPNDLLDRRDLLVEKLGHLVPVTVDHRDSDEFMVHVNGLVLVQGKVARSLDMKGADAEGFAHPVWSDTGMPYDAKGGNLGALLGLRDGDVKKEVQTLDTLALSFTDLVNETHRAGYGLNGKTGIDFFTEYPAVNDVSGNYDLNGDGKFDSTMIYRMTGKNALDGQALVGFDGTMRLPGAKGVVKVDYHPTDTVADVVDRINVSGAEITARLDREGRLELRATASSASAVPGTTGTPAAAPDFVIRHVEDSGHFLVGYAGLLKSSGPAGAFDWGGANAANSLAVSTRDFAVAPLSHPSGWLQVNEEIKNDPGSIAAGFGENGKPAAPGDGTAAIAIAALRTKPVMVGSQRTFDDHFADAVARVGLEGERAQTASQTHDRIGKELRDLRQSNSGVNMDEELADMIKFQHGYAASAKFMSTMNDMLDTIINRMGV
ncbi:MAG TPA: flagellar hook-associated protein FlgK [Rectinemataceae bacterium]|nr:flagellar hook-associated protein FlgK [Rectinemataceae bacterium]